MSRSIIIGDVHGCYYTLQALLSTVEATPEDHLYFLGDLVGKGPYSEKVMDFVSTRKNVTVILGNNDLYWMYDYFHVSRRNDLGQLSLDSSAKAWIDFLIKQPFCKILDEGVLVHASVFPEWDEQTLVQVSHDLSEKLRKDPKQFLDSLKDEVTVKRDDDRRSFHILTECRYYNQQGEFEKQTGAPEDHPDLIPWYLKDRRIHKPIIFGHWARLRGRKLDGVINLDGGAVYGGTLMALVDGKEIVRVEKDDKDR